MRCNRFPLTAMIASLACRAALAQPGDNETAPLHGVPIGVGRTASGQLTTLGGDPNLLCFDPRVDVGLFQRLPLDPNSPPERYRTDLPGFDASFPAYPEHDFYPLEPGSIIYLVAAADFPAAYSISYGTTVIRKAGERLPLGTERLHRHCVFNVECADPGWDPLRVTWFGSVYLSDDGAHNYADSDPFLIRLATVQCQPGDINDDGAVNFADINPFVRVLGDAGAATEKERCATDCNRDGLVNFADINPFVTLLAGDGVLRP